MANTSEQLLNQIRQCRLCEASLPLPANPIIQLSAECKIQIIGQAPGLVTHEQNLPFKDKSGDRLRQWLDVSESEFYNPDIFSITPMAFCYPGKNKSGSGDAPPPKLCQQTWHQAINANMPKLQLRILIGSYAAKAYLQHYSTLELMIRQKIQDPTIVLPHPSPRNNIWLKKNPWFARDIIPALQQRVRSCC